MTTKPTDFKVNNNLTTTINKMVASTGNSTARYFTIDVDGCTRYTYEDVCFNAISSRCADASGLGIIFQGYGGFDENNRAPKKAGHDRWRAATEADLYTNVPIPFTMADKGHYNEVSLQWLEMLLDPEGPFKSILPALNETDPKKVQEQRCFIFPDVSLIPARLTWCFAIASRLGYANPRVVWRYLHLLAKGVDKRTAMLIAGGFEHEVKAGQITGRIIKSYTCGFLGVDTTAYAGRFLTSSPVKDALGASKNGTYGSSKVFESGKMDLKNMTFDTWDEVIGYTQQRGRDQAKELKLEFAEAA